MSQESDTFNITFPRMIIGFHSAACSACKTLPSASPAQFGHICIMFSIVFTDNHKNQI